MKVLAALEDQQSRQIYLQNLFKSSLGFEGFVKDMIYRVSQIPIFFFEYTDPEIEWSHFSSWWNGIAVRPYNPFVKKQYSYNNKYLHDLYLLHEICHILIATPKEFPEFSEWSHRKLKEEFEASFFSEQEVHVYCPYLKSAAFSDNIYYDQTIGLAINEMRDKRAKDQFGKNETTDPQILRLRKYSADNIKWAYLWEDSFESVEASTFYLNTGIISMQEHIDWLMRDGSIPFADKAKAFKEIL